MVFHYGIERFISFRSQVEYASWDETRNAWNVQVRGHSNLQCEILFNASGILNNIQHPRIRHLDRFSGPFLHTAAWDSNIDLKGKRVAIVGAGASAIQLLPAIQQQVQHADIYIRTPSWIVPLAGHTANAEPNHVYTREEKQQFHDQDFSVRTRKAMETTYNSIFKAFEKGSEDQKNFRAKVEARMRELIRDPTLQAKLIPDFEVGCRRINPGEAYLEALQQENVEPIFDSIEEVTSGGIIAGGKVRPVDIIIAATGFDTSFRPRFPIIGQHGRDLRQLWKDEPVSYFGTGVAGFPNYLTFLGPNTPISNGSLMGTLEATADYFVRLIRKFVQENAVSFTVREDVQRDFDIHTQAAMQNLVWTGRCRSWYKLPSGKIAALWPGSSLHYRQVLESNRWEDYEWKYAGNRFSFWGRGLSDLETSVDTDPAVDLAFYIKEHDVLPLEAYYAAAGGYPCSVMPMGTFRSDVEEGIKREHRITTGSPVNSSDSESSWELQTPEVNTKEAAAIVGN